jgi:asparagine synthase (glutamine-hydrolysing)
MCGISGVVAIDGRLAPELQRAMPAMTWAIRHRGPDGGSVSNFPGASFGHRRLAIIDRAGGQQPLSNEDGSVWVVFNGEIYNHRDLRHDLIARGHRFRTVSDTEVIVHAYEEYGTACVDRFDGMFAFAVYDRVRHELFIARDRLGKKPLFWGIFAGALHFGSEIKVLAQSPVFDDTIDLSALEGYLSLGYFLAPQTVYRHVHKLLPGHWLRLRNGQVTTHQYWDVTRFDDDRRDVGAITADLEGLLREAVHDRLESEVPLGAFLSGGIDSALTVSFMGEQTGQDVITTSVGFGESAHNELEAAGRTARHLHTRHYPEIVTPRLEDILDTIVGSFDEPFADASAIPTYYVSQMARRHVTVALSGDGGDEAFAGYDFRYVPHAVESAIASAVPGAPGRAVMGLLGRMWPRSPRMPRPMRLARTFENLATDRAGAYYADLCFLKPDTTRALLGLAPSRRFSDSPVYDAVTEPYRRCPSTDAVQRAEYADIKIYLANDVLVKVDRMSMAHGLEVRCPLLDRRVVEFAFRVPATMKMPRLQSKALLRRIARGRIPDQILDLPKHGFTAPVSEWLAGPYAETFRSEVLGPDSTVSALLDARQIGRMFAQHCTGQRDHAYALWAVWMLERWARQRQGGATHQQDRNYVADGVA